MLDDEPNDLLVSTSGTAALLVIVLLLGIDLSMCHLQYYHDTHMRRVCGLLIGAPSQRSIYGNRTHTHTVNTFVLGAQGIRYTRRNLHFWVWPVDIVVVAYARAHRILRELSAHCTL